MPKSKKLNEAKESQEGTSPTLSVFSFHSYKQFIQAVLNKKPTSKHVKKITMKELARKAAVSPGYLSLVLANKRKPHLEIIHDLAEALELSKTERRAFELLYLIEESKSEKLRHESYSELRSMKDYVERNPNEAAAHQYLSKWYYVAIRELVTLPDFQYNVEWIQNRLSTSLSAREVFEALNFLTTNGLIIQSDKGRWIQSTHNLRCDDAIYNFSLGNFYQQVMGLASQSIEGVAKDYRHLASYSLALNRNQFEKIREILESSLDQIQDFEKEQSKSDTNTSTDVYHISVLAFPFTEILSSNKLEKLESNS